jgi:predicted glutamine amidotransferase
VRKSTTAAAHDRGFAQHARDVTAAAQIGHLRLASPGLPVGRMNTHPFLGDGIAFAHNGSLLPADRIEDLLDEPVRADLTGTTDSERYFALVRQLRTARPDADLPSAMREAAALLRARFPSGSLNALALDGEHLVVVHANPRAVAPDELAELFQRAGLPDEHNETYGVMRLARAHDGGVLVCSTGVLGRGWEALPPESVTTIRLRDLSIVTSEIPAMTAEIPVS